MRRGVDGAVQAVAGNSSGATSGKSKRSCSGNQSAPQTVNLRGVAELSILSMWQEAAMRDVRPRLCRLGVRFGHDGMSALSPFYPQLRTLVGAVDTAAPCRHFLVGECSNTGGCIDHGLLTDRDEADIWPVKIEDYEYHPTDQRAHDVDG